MLVKRLSADKGSVSGSSNLQIFVEEEKFIVKKMMDDGTVIHHPSSRPQPGFPLFPLVLPFKYPTFAAPIKNSRFTPAWNLDFSGCGEIGRHVRLRI